MKNYELKIANHPAQARNPLTNVPLVDENGEPVPLFPKQRSVKFDGVVVAYVSEECNVQIIRHGLGQVIEDEIFALVEKELGPVAKSHVIAKPVEVEVDEDDEEEF